MNATLLGFIRIAIASGMYLKILWRANIIHPWALFPVIRRTVSKFHLLYEESESHEKGYVPDDGQDKIEPKLKLARNIFDENDLPLGRKLWINQVIRGLVEADSANNIASKCKKRMVETNDWVSSLQCVETAC